MVVNINSSTYRIRFWSRHCHSCCHRLSCSCLAIVLLEVAVQPLLGIHTNIQTPPNSFRCHNLTLPLSLWGAIINTHAHTRLYTTTARQPKGFNAEIRLMMCHCFQHSLPAQHSSVQPRASEDSKRILRIWIFCPSTHERPVRMWFVSYLKCSWFQANWLSLHCNWWWWLCSWPTHIPQQHKRGYCSC